MEVQSQLTPSQRTEDGFLCQARELFSVDCHPESVFHVAQNHQSMCAKISQTVLLGWKADRTLG